MRVLGVALLALVTSLTGIATAEIYQDIAPLDTLADVSAKFPNATLEHRAPAWAQPTDVLISLQGRGISGSIVVKFYDGRPNYRRSAETAENDELKKQFEEWANESDENALTVEWVRWIPAEPIPLKRFVAKYGEPDSTGFRDDNMRPYRQWDRGILANLDDDLKNVTDVEFTFTKAEQRAAWQKRHGFVPDFLKEPPAAPKSKPARPAPKRSPKNGEARFDIPVYKTTACRTVAA